MKKTRLTFSFALLATAGAWAQTFTVDNLKYTVADADAGTVELIGYKEQPTGKLVIPSTVTCDGTEYSVTRIGNEAFGFCYNLTGITIPEGVTHMGFGAFQYCTSLEQVAIPEDVTSIENWTFGYCSALTEMTIPGSVTSIGDNAFYKCVSLNQVTIPESVTTFGKDAFRSCTLLTQMTIPVDGIITRHFSRNDNYLGVGIQAAPNSPVTSIDDGTVVDVLTSTQTGITVTVQHFNGFLSVYRNLSQTLVARGQAIKSGQVIGYNAMHKAGDKDNPLLEFEIWHEGKPVDPEMYIVF